MLEKNGFQIIEIIDYENHSTIYRVKNTTKYKSYKPYLYSKL